MRAVPLYDLRIAAGFVVDVFRGWSHQSCTKSMIIAAQAPYPALSDSYLCALRAVLGVWYRSRSNAGQWIRTDGERGFCCCFHPVIVSFNSTIAHILPRHHTTKQILLHHTATLQ